MPQIHNLPVSLTLIFYNNYNSQFIINKKEKLQPTWKIKNKNDIKVRHLAKLIASLIHYLLLDFFIVNVKSGWNIDYSIINQYNLF